MDPDIHQLAALFPNISAQLRGALSNLHLAAAQLATPEARDADPTLDARAAFLDQSYYQLLRLVNNLSAAAVLPSDASMPLQDQDVVDLVEKICVQAESLARVLALDFSFSCELERHICAVSAEGMEQLLFQLLSNAFKFTPAGGSVTVELKAVNERVLLSVADTGCGIEEERLATLFDRYLHPDRMDPRPHGLGLGLSLCCRVAEGMGGRILAESKPGKGTRFTLSIPDRRAGSGVSDIPFDYTGGFNRALLALSDALPAKAFLFRNQD